MASLADINDFGPVPRRRRPLVRLYAEAVLLEHDARRLQNTVREVIANPEQILTPFGLARQLEDAEDEQRYDHDNDPIH